MLPLEAIEDAEIRERLLAGGVPNPGRLAFPAAPSFVSGFGSLELDAVGELLRAPRLTTVATGLVHPKNQDTVRAIRSQGGRWARRFHRDRSVEEIPFEVAEEQLDRQLIELLRARTRGCHDELVRKADQRYLAEVGGVLRFPEATCALALLPDRIEGLRGMPSWYCMQRLARAAAANFGDRDGQTRFFSDQKRAGAWCDWNHVAIGAGYCDSFVCDAQTARLLGTSREDIGLSAPTVVEGNDYDGFAQSLRESVAVG
jgi:hypothetical protein